MLYTKNSSEMNINPKCELWKHNFMLLSDEYFKNVNNMNGKFRSIINDVHSCDVNTQLDIIHDTIRKNKK
jgi:hypothetical protein